MDDKNIELVQKMNEFEMAESMKSDLYYIGALAHLKNKNYDKALAYAEEAQSPTIKVYEYPFSYPRGFYIKGMAYEKMGDYAKAKENYEALLALWKDADSNIPELIDTKKRLANLKQTS